MDERKIDGYLRIPREKQGLSALCRRSLANLSHWRMHRGIRLLRDGVPAKFASKLGVLVSSQNLASSVHPVAADMEVGDKLKELNMTSDELGRLSKAFKDETFMGMLRDYAEEISNPENKKRYEEEITILEGERGNNVEFIHPEPFRVLRTSVDGQKKCYINICSNGKVGKPECKNGVSEEGHRGQCWSLPHSLHPARPDRDSKGNVISIYDVIFHPDTLHIASKNQRFMDMVEGTAIQGIQDAFKVTLDKNNMRHLKIKYKGTPRPCVTRKPIPGFQTPSEDPGPLAFQYPDSKKPSEPAESPAEPRKFQLQPQSRTAEPTKPRYSVKYRSVVDMQDFRCSRDSARGPRPREIVVTVDLPLLERVSDTELEVKENRLLQLDSRKPAYRLELPLAYPVDQDQGTAKFDKHKRQLVVTLPVLPPEEAFDYSWAPCDGDPEGGGGEGGEEESGFDGGERPEMQMKEEGEEGSWREGDGGEGDGGVGSGVEEKGGWEEQIGEGEECVGEERGDEEKGLDLIQVGGQEEGGEGGGGGGGGWKELNGEGEESVGEEMRMEEDDEGERGNKRKGLEPEGGEDEGGDGGMRGGQEGGGEEGRDVEGEEKVGSVGEEGKLKDDVDEGREDEEDVVMKVGGGIDEGMTREGEDGGDEGEEGMGSVLEEERRLEEEKEEKIDEKELRKRGEEREKDGTWTLEHSTEEEEGANATDQVKDSAQMEATEDHGCRSAAEEAHESGGKDEEDEDDLQTVQTTGHQHQDKAPPLPVLLREVDEDGKENIISDHTTSAGFAFQNTLMFELD